MFGRFVLSRFLQGFGASAQLLKRFSLALPTPRIPQTSVSGQLWLWSTTRTFTGFTRWTIICARPAQIPKSPRRKAGKWVATPRCCATLCGFTRLDLRLGCC